MRTYMYEIRVAAVNVFESIPRKLPTRRVDNELDNENTLIFSFQVVTHCIQCHRLVKIDQRLSF